MGTKVKGLLKGLRYISQIFDEKEEEIQIGFPTDVKHVAHIGLDGPSANTPTWMNDFKSSSDLPSAPVNSLETSQDNPKSSGPQRVRDVPPKSRHHSIDNQTDSPSKRSSDGSKHSRRHRSSDPSSDSSVRDASSRGSRHSRRHQSPNQESDSPAHDASGAPKHARRRKSKTTSTDDTDRSSRRSSKGGNSMTDISLPDIGSENGYGSKVSEGLETEK